MSTEATHAKPGRKKYQIISYYSLRVLIGASGVLLPLLVWIGKLIYNHSIEVEYSISDYYDNGTAGDILVGVLFALSFFLLSYRGYDAMDNRVSNLGSIFALGVALCPTTSEEKLVHTLHFVFAFLLFTVFIIFSIYLFRQSSPSKDKTDEKDKRNNIYLLCGIIMIACIAGIALCNFVFEKASIKYHLVFWFESVMLVSFGFSWITKSEMLFLKDSGSPKSAKPEEIAQTPGK